jgi:hypothetical protein
MGLTSEDTRCLHVALVLTLEHSCGKKHLKILTHSCMFYTLYCKIIIGPTVINLVSGEVLVINNIEKYTEVDGGIFEHLL